MRALVMMAAVLVGWGPALLGSALAQTQLPRLTGGPNSIMVGGETKATPAQRRQARRALERRQRTQARRTRRSLEARSGSPATGSGQLRSSINRSIELQQRQLRASQQNQFEINQLRQRFQPNSIAPPIGTGAPGCPAGSIGCWSSPGCPRGSIGC